MVVRKWTGGGSSVKRVPEQKRYVSFGGLLFSQDQDAPALERTGPREIQVGVFNPTYGCRYGVRPDTSS